MPVFGTVAITIPSLVGHRWQWMRRQLRQPGPGGRKWRAISRRARSVPARVHHQSLRAPLSAGSVGHAARRIPDRLLLAEKNHSHSQPESDKKVDEKKN